MVEVVVVATKFYTPAVCELMLRIIEIARVFGAAADDLSDETCDADGIWELPWATNITVGDLRAIRRAIAAFDAAARDFVAQNPAIDRRSA